MQAYQEYGMPNFSILQGKRLCVAYDDGNIDEGTTKLLSYLNQILASNTASVYLLRVYPENVPVNSSTGYSGSTTFMLSPQALTTTAPGPGGVGSVQIIDRGGQVQQYQGSKELAARVEKLEAENRNLLDRVHKAELDNIRTEFTNQIAGIRKDHEQDSKGSWHDRLFDFLEKKPEAIDKVGNMLQGIAGIFRSNKDYIINKGPGAAAAVSGTKQTAENSDTMNTDQQVQLTPEGALINPFLEPAERDLKSSEQSRILIERLTPLDQEKHDEIQSECLEIIESRIGAVTLSRMLLAVAGMSSDGLNKLINHLD
jgi:hypothetical protein